MWKQLNLPYIKEFEDAQNILIAGAGGGFDVFAGLPLYFELEQRGKKVHLANYSFSDFAICQSEIHQELNPACRGVSGSVITAGLRHEKSYYPEGCLAEWLKEKGYKDLKIWMLQKLGVKPTKKSYEQLIEQLGIDTLILVDGGVDSLFHGDEEEHGTILEDTVSLAATYQLPIKNKLLACIGFGTEAEDHVCHYHVLKNIAKLIENEEFRGSCSIYNRQYGFQMMDEAYCYTVGTKTNSESHITPRIIAAGFGLFGNKFENMTNIPNLLINPLMNMYWFFNLCGVVKENKLINSNFCNTITSTDVLMTYREQYKTIKSIPSLPLPY